MGEPAGIERSPRGGEEVKMRGGKSALFFCPADAGKVSPTGTLPTFCW